MTKTLNVFQAKNVTNTTEVEVTVAFPNHLYRQVSKSSVSEPQLLNIERKKR